MKKKIKPVKKGNFYYCPFLCHKGSVYPAKKWKGIDFAEKHIETCSFNPINIENKQKNEFEMLEAKKERNKIAMEQGKTILENCQIKIGDNLYGLSKYVLKDTHERRGNRIIKVRYEQVFSWSWKAIVVESIDLKISNGGTPYLLINDKYRICDLYKSRNEVEEKIKFNKEQQEISLKKASNYR